MQKRKKVRLKGKPLVQLNIKIHERDDHICIIGGCGRYVLNDGKFQHEPCGNAKEDRIERGCLLCDFHHDIRRHGKKGLQEIRRQRVEYLSNLYPRDWAEIKDRWAGEEI
jgi:hypothetical protein